MQTAEETLTLARRFLTQEAELYGDVFYVSPPAPTTLSVPAGPIPSIANEADACRDCALAKTRRHMVPGKGNEKARLMLISGSPGEEDDREGVPLIGAAGDLLSNILSAIGFERGEVYVSHLVKCRPPNNRKPRPDELRRCEHRLTQEIARVKPAMILALGQTAGQWLLGEHGSIEALRGRFHDYHGIPLMVTYHPATLLRQPDKKRPVWEDVQILRKEYDTLVGDKPAWRPPQK